MKNLTSLLCFLSLFCLAFPLFAQTESCTDKRYIDEIFEFERDLTDHARIEDNILVPKVMAMEKMLKHG